MPPFTAPFYSSALPYNAKAALGPRTCPQHVTDIVCACVHVCVCFIGNVTGTYFGIYTWSLLQCLAKQDYRATLYTEKRYKNLKFLTYAWRYELGVLQQTISYFWGKQISACLVALTLRACQHIRSFNKSCRLSWNTVAPLTNFTNFLYRQRISPSFDFEWPSLPICDFSWQSLSTFDFGLPTLPTSIFGRPTLPSSEFLLPSGQVLSFDHLAFAEFWPQMTVLINPVKGS